MRLILKQAGIEPRIWVMELLHAVYLYNRTSATFLRMKAPREDMFREYSNKSKVRMFACAAYSHRDSVYRTRKYDDRTDIGVYFGARHGLYGIRNRKAKFNVTKNTKCATKDMLPSLKGNMRL